MSTKKQNYFLINDFSILLNKLEGCICLFTHISNLNNIELNQIKLFCNNNNIGTKYIKINILKKLTKNLLFKNLLAGPTQLFFFFDLNTFINFISNLPINKKIVPLAIFYNNNFFFYNFFINYCKKNINKLSTRDVSVSKDILLMLYNANINIFNSFNNVIKQFIFFLTKMIIK